jgi:CRISPR-associated protein Cas2
MSRHRFLVAYDVSDPKRLRRVYKKLNGYGDALQYSVFRCELSPKEKELMVEALWEIIHHKEDRVLIVDLGPARGRGRKAVRFIGRSVPPPDAGPVVF